MVIGQRHLERGIGAFRSRIGEEHPVEPGRHDLCQFARQTEGQRMAELERRREIERAHGFGHGCADRGPAMPGIDAPQPRSRSSRRRPSELV
jgi:hypothetical protein